MLKKLGKSFDDILEKVSSPSQEPTIQSVPISLIDVSPYQPRKEFKEGEITSLAESIKKEGLLQPIVVRRKADRYELIAGERRLRACRYLKIEFIEVKIVSIPDQKVLPLALIENMQREDLNPIEKATSFKRLMNELQMTQDEVAKIVGIDRSSVANFIRLLELPKELQEHVSRGTLTFGHARAILSLKNKEDQFLLYEKIEKEGLSVRECEKLVEKMNEKKEYKLEKNKGGIITDLFSKEMEDKLSDIFGTKVKLKTKKNKTGEIIIYFYDTRDLDRIVSIITP